MHSLVKVYYRLKVYHRRQDTGYGLSRIISGITPYAMTLQALVMTAILDAKREMDLMILLIAMNYSYALYAQQCNGGIV